MLFQQQRKKLIPHAKKPCKVHTLLATQFRPPLVWKAPGNLFSEPGHSDGAGRGEIEKERRAEEVCICSFAITLIFFFDKVKSMRVPSMDAQPGIIIIIIINIDHFVFILLFFNIRPLSCMAMEDTLAHAPHATNIVQKMQFSQELR